MWVVVRIHARIATEDLDGKMRQRTRGPIGTTSHRVPRCIITTRRSLRSAIHKGANLPPQPHQLRHTVGPPPCKAQADEVQLPEGTNIAPVDVASLQAAAGTILRAMGMFLMAVANPLAARANPPAAGGSPTAVEANLPAAGLSHPTLGRPKKIGSMLLRLVPVGPPVNEPHPAQAGNMTLRITLLWQALGATALPVAKSPARPPRETNRRASMILPKTWRASISPRPETGLLAVANLQDRDAGSLEGGQRVWSTPGAVATAK